MLSRRKKKSCNLYIYGLIFIFIGYFLPLLINLFIDLSLIKELKTINDKKKEMTIKKSNSNDDSAKRTFKNVIIIAFLNFLFGLPELITLILFNLFFFVKSSSRAFSY